MTAKPCWICKKNPANSKEHRIKKSDFVFVMGRPNQDDVRFYHSSKGKNIPVKGADAGILKYDDNLCTTCNTTRTQPHDCSWARLSKALLSDPTLVKVGNSIRLNKIFPNNTRQHKRNVHLFFLKQFGCFIQSGIGEPSMDKKSVLEKSEIEKILDSLSTTIMKDKWHPHVYLSFGRTPLEGFEGQVGKSNLDMIRKSDSSIVGMGYFYYIGPLSVGVLYDVENSFHVPGDIDHAKYVFKTIKMRDYITDGREKIYLETKGVGVN